MWEAISNILTSSNALQTVVSILILVLVIVIMAKTGMLRIKTTHVNIGMSDRDKERTIIREQCDWVHTYLEGLQGKIASIVHESKYGGFFTKYVLEVVYDEIVKWITFNHIEDSERYVTVKQDKIASLVYSMGVSDEFKTKEFNQRMKNWVEEVINELLEIRKLYS